METEKTVLMLCPKPLYPLRDGGCVAMYAIWHGLNLYNREVDILTAFSYKHPLDLTDLPAGMQISGVELDLRPRLFKALKNLFSRRSYILERFQSAEMATLLREKLQQTDYAWIQIESLFMTPYIPLIRQYTAAKIVVRPANVESEIWMRLARKAFGLKKWYYQLLAKRLQRDEILWLNRADLVLPLTDRDTATFRRLGVQVPMHTLSVGISDTLAPVEVEPEYPSIFYIGALNWLPNIEGIDWFLKKVWPRIHRRCPDLTFYLAGRYMPSRLRNLRMEKVVVMGEVEDAKLFMASKGVMVVPVLSGSGIRIKIMEGMVAGRPVVTTTMGAEGLDYRPGQDLWIADTVETFAEAVEYAVTHRDEAEAVGENGRRLMLRHHNIEKITAQLIDYCR